MTAPFHRAWQFSRNVRPLPLPPVAPNTCIAATHRSRTFGSRSVCARVCSPRRLAARPLSEQVDVLRPVMAPPRAGDGREDATTAPPPGATAARSDSESVYASRAHHVLRLRRFQGEKGAGFAVEALPFLRSSALLAGQRRTASENCEFPRGSVMRRSPPCRCATRLHRPCYVSSRDLASRLATCLGCV
jgi:hypothetical protein